MLDIYKSALKQGYELWQAGGWAMYPLGINAFILYAKAAQIRVELGRKAFRPLERIARRRLDPCEHASLAARYLHSRDIDVPPDASLEEMEHSFEELRATELPPLERDLRFLKVAMSAAPLWGLLGTVTGMLSTFDGLARGGGGDKTMNMVASGISEALITTQTGLMIALPGYFFFYYLSGYRDRYEAFLAGIETAYTQANLHLAPEEPSSAFPLPSGV